MLRNFSPFILLCFMLTLPANASTNNLNDYKNAVIELNRNIGTYYFIGDSISGNIETAANRKVGTVQDFLINDQGEVQTLVAELNHLGLGKEPLNLAYNDISRNKDAFTLASQAANMEEELASFLANIETAAGEAEADLISARRLHGRQILLPSGEAIAEVEHVLTDKETKKVIGVLVKDLSTRPNYERFALPYPHGLHMKNTGLSNDLELSEKYVDVVKEFTAEGIPE